MRAKGAALVALLLGAAWVGCGDDTPARCNEALGYVCQKGAAGASGEGGAGPGGASGTAGTGGTAGLGGGGAGGGNGGSGGLACGALEVDCDGACVNVKADNADHCGACGRSCLGSTCEAGACVPEAMTSAGEVAPYALADDGTYLYWVSPAIKVGGSVNDSRMRRVAKASAGGAAENVFDGGRVRARSIGFDGGKLYFGDLDAAGVFSGTPGSAFPDSPAFAADQLDVRHLVIAASKAFWSVGGEGAVRGKPLAGGAFAPDVLGQPNPAWVAADEAGAPYWVAGVTREVRRTKAAAPGYEAFATGAGIVAVELAGDAVSWADAAAGVIRSAPKTATPPAPGVVAFEGRGRVEGFRLEGTTLYVVTLQTGALITWRKAEGDVEPFLLGRVPAKAAGYAGNPFGAAHVLADSEYLYFADVGTVDAGQVVPESAGDGVVYRVAK